MGNELDIFTLGEVTLFRQHSVFRVSGHYMSFDGIIMAEKLTLGVHETDDQVRERFSECIRLGWKNSGLGLEHYIDNDTIQLLVEQSMLFREMCIEDGDLDALVYVSVTSRFCYEIKLDEPRRNTKII